MDTLDFHPGNVEGPNVMVIRWCDESWDNSVRMEDEERAVEQICDWQEQSIEQVVPEVLPHIKDPSFRSG
jgi:hypothetical protein